MISKMNYNAALHFPELSHFLLKLQEKRMNQYLLGFPIKI